MWTASVLLVSVLLVVALEESFCSIAVAVRCIDGVVIGADSLAVSGILVSNRQSEKVFEITEDTVISCAGGSFDFYELLADLRSMARQNEHQGRITTSMIAKFARKLVYGRYRSAHVIISGVDEKQQQQQQQQQQLGEESSQLQTCVDGTVLGNEQPDRVDAAAMVDTRYCVHEILPGGTIIKQNFAVAGTGAPSVFALLEDLFNSEEEEEDGYTTRLLSNQDQRAKDIDGIWHHMTEHDVDSRWCNNKQQLPTVAETINRVKRVLRAAISYDPRSGGCLRLWKLTKQYGLQPVAV